MESPTILGLVAKVEISDALEELPKPGDVLAGKYLIQQTIGHGGMGVVFAGQHQALQQPVAIKFLRPEHSKSGDSLKRFLREARAAARIRNVHATRIFDIDSTPSGVPYIVMERLEGENVDRVLEVRGAFSVQLAVDCVLQACEALAEAHAAGLVHRDLKPSNLFLVTEPQGGLSLKVLDFGISKLLTGDDLGTESNLTGPNTLLGSPQYMSPEQVRAHPVDARTDIWALGVILFELLVVAPPFQADSIPHLYALILSAAPTRLRQRLPKAPQALEDVILRCLQKDPAHRPQDVGELAVLLEPFASPSAAAAVARIRSTLDKSLTTAPSSASDPVLSSRPAGRAGVDPAFEPTVAAGGSRGRSWGLAALGVAALAVALAVLLPRLAGSTSGSVAPVAAPPSPVAESVPPVAAPSPSAAPSATGAGAPAPAPAGALDGGARPLATTSPAASAPPRVHDLRGIKLLP